MLCRAVFGRMPKPLKGTTMENSQNSFGSSTQELFIAMVVTLFVNAVSLLFGDGPTCSFGTGKTLRQMCLLGTAGSSRTFLGLRQEIVKRII